MLSARTTRYIFKALHSDIHLAHTKRHEHTKPIGLYKSLKCFSAEGFPQPSSRSGTRVERPVYPG